MHDRADEGQRKLEHKGVVVMPQNDGWERWNWSSAIKIHLRSQARYDLLLCDDGSMPQQEEGALPLLGLLNMTYLDHFTAYTNDGSMLGGGKNTANFVNIARLRLLFLHKAA